MNKVKFSVLLSIYYKEKPEYFRECMESIYSQTVLPDEIVLVEDGRLTEELYEAISDYECRPSEINFVHHSHVIERIALSLILLYHIISERHCPF